MKKRQSHPVDFGIILRRKLNWPKMNLAPKIPSHI
ncbi:MAG: hypothetical protein ACI9YL_001971 [Luteibaculaceae bacterium]